MKPFLTATAWKRHPRANRDRAPTIVGATLYDSYL